MDFLPFLEHLIKAFDAGKLEFFSSRESLRERSWFLDHLAPLREAEWVVYAKRSFVGPQQVLDYVGRYTHRVAVSNNRLLDFAEGNVKFRYKDYRHEAQQKTMTLEAEEFIRRFLLHVLPDGFQLIRYYGFLANRYRDEKLTRCRELLGMPAPEATASEVSKDYSERYEELTGSSLWECPVCHQGRMLVMQILPRSPHWHLTPIRTPHDEKDCFGIQIQLCRTSLAGPRAAVIYSIIESCRCHGVEPYSYLSDVLTRLPSMINRQIKDMTSKSWAAASVSSRTASSAGTIVTVTRLLPEWVPHFEMVSDIYPEWEPFVKRWVDVTALFEREALHLIVARRFRLMKTLRASTRWAVWKDTRCKQPDYVPKLVARDLSLPADAGK